MYSESEYIAPYTSPYHEDKNMTRYYEKIFGASDKWAEDLNRNKGDDEYWNEYVKSEMAEVSSKSNISVKSNKDKVVITLSREEAMNIVERYASDALREVLRAFFIKNKDVSDLDINLNEKVVEVVEATVPF